MRASTSIHVIDADPLKVDCTYITLEGIDYRSK